MLNPGDSLWNTPLYLGGVEDEALRRTERDDARHCLCSVKSLICPQKLTVLCSLPSDLLLSSHSGCFFS